MSSKLSLSTTILIIVGFTIYSLTGVFSKLASMYPFLSIAYVAFFACTIVMLGIYAVMWQIILKRMPLNIAFLCKSSTIIISMMFARFLFNENITLKNGIGALIILIGLIVLAWKK